MVLAAGGAAIWIALGVVAVAGLVVVVFTASRDRTGDRRFKRWAATRAHGPAPAPLLDPSELLVLAEADLVVVHATVGTTEGPWHVAVARWSAGTDRLLARYTTVCVGLDAPAPPAAIVPAPADAPAGALGRTAAARRRARASGAFGLRSPLRWPGGTATVPDTGALGIDVLAGEAAGVQALVDPLAAELGRPDALSVGATRFAVERIGASLVVVAPGVPRQIDALVTRAVELAARLGAPGDEVAVLA
jgi:hypothetical protein